MSTVGVGSAGRAQPLAISARLRVRGLRAFSIWLVLTAAGSVLAPNGARAQSLRFDPPNRGAKPSRAAVREAKEHFARGLELYKEGAPQRALFEFRRAYQLAPNFRVLYNGALCFLAMHDYAGAMRAFERFLLEGRGQIEVVRRTEVDRQLVKLRSRVARISLQVEPTGAQVRVNGEFVGAAPIAQPVVVNIGRNRIQVRKDKYENRETAVEVTGGEERAVRIRLEAEIVRPPPVASAYAVGAGPNREPQPRRSPWIWVGTGSAIAMGVAALTTGLLTMSAENDADRQLATVPGNPQAIDDAQDRARRFAISTDVLAAAALVTAAVTLGFGLRARAKRHQRQTAALRLRWNGRQAGFAARF